jgi:hypothetical protein
MGAGTFTAVGVFGDPDEGIGAELSVPAIGELLNLAARLVNENPDLAEPVRMAMAYPVAPHLSFQLEPDPASIEVLVDWAQRFGGVISTAEMTAVDGGDYRFVRVTFPADGRQVQLFVRLPLDASR